MTRTATATPPLRMPIVACAVTDAREISSCMGSLRPSGVNGKHNCNGLMQIARALNYYTGISHMAAVTATARRSMCIVATRQAVSKAVIGDSWLARADPAAACGSHEGEVSPAHAFSPHDFTDSLPEPSLFGL